MGNKTDRATTIGVYRWWRDLGYVAGAILAGILADRFGLAVSVFIVGVITILSGLVLAATYLEEARSNAFQGTRRAHELLPPL